MPGSSRQGRRARRCPPARSPSATPSTDAHSRAAQRRGHDTTGAGWEKFFRRTAVDNLVHNPVEICAASLPPPRAALARIADASFLSSRGAR